MNYHRTFDKIDKTDFTSGAGNVYPSGASKLTSWFLLGS